MITFTSISSDIAFRWMAQGFTGVVNIGAGNGLAPSGNKPLPEPMLTKVHDAICHH